MPYASTLQFDGIGVRVFQLLPQLFMLRMALVATVAEEVPDLFKTFVAEIQAPRHQQRCDQPLGNRGDKNCGGHKNRLVQQGAPEHREHHGQFPVRRHARDFFGIDRQVITQNTRSLARRHLGHDGDVIHERGNIVQQ